MIRGLAWGWLLALVAAAAADDGQATLPEVVRTKHRSFQIPFRPPQSRDGDADAATARIMLDVSRDLGITWQSAGETAPTSGSLTYTADTDGEYWFRLRAVDRKGRVRGGAGPDMRVLVDAAGPRLAARVWKGADGEIVCRYAAADDSLRLESLKLEYRGPADVAWKTVATQPILSRESPAHAVGEDIWWAGEKVESLAVRIAISDASGNVTTRQFKLEPSDPQVDQAALAREIGVPPLPDASASVVSSASPPTAGTMAAADPTVGSASQPNHWPAEPAGPWAGDQPPGAAGGRSQSVLVRRPDPNQAFLPRSDGDLSSRFTTAAHRQPAAAEMPLTGVGQPLTYQGKPLHIARSRQFSWDYEAPAPSAAGRLRAELWCTRDGGVTWQRAVVDEDGRSPIDVRVDAPGLYGVRLEIVADVPDAGSGPRSGDTPEAWLGVDEEPPHVELLGVARAEAATGAAAGGGAEPGLVIRYAARDPLLGPRATRILYSPHAEGPWATVAEGLENQGEYRWRPDRGVPARVHIRVEATDAAGNLGAASTPEPISVAAPRFIGKLGGLRPSGGQTP